MLVCFGSHAPSGPTGECKRPLLDACTLSQLYYLKKPLNQENLLVIVRKIKSALWGIMFPPQSCTLSHDLVEGSQGLIFLAYPARTCQGIQDP